MIGGQRPNIVVLASHNTGRHVSPYGIFKYNPRSPGQRHPAASYKYVSRSHWAPGITLSAAAKMKSFRPFTFSTRRSTYSLYSASGYDGSKIELGSPPQHTIFPSHTLK